MQNESNSVLGSSGNESDGIDVNGTRLRAIQDDRAHQGGGRHEIVMDDDGKGEAADIVGISLDSLTLPKLITFDLYHCKYSSAPEPGSRIEDMYEVCGQAQRSLLWLHNKDRRTDLFAHLLKREALRIESGRVTRFDVVQRNA